MKQTFKPILFSTDMVQAILEDRKNQTRRTRGFSKINKDPEKYKFLSFSIDFKYLTFDDLNTGFFQGVTNTIGKPGDILWVRETFHYVDDAVTKEFLRYGYRADKDWDGAVWKPSIFMPKEACRIFLKITGLRVERLQDITTEDAIYEGIEVIDGEVNDCPVFKNYLKPGIENGFGYPTNSFQSLWESINGKDSWNKNPWVWVITFERIDKPQGFN